MTDLLWKIRNPPGAGSGQTPPSIVGSTVIRVLGRISFAYTSPLTESGLYFGVLVDPYGTAQQTSMVSVDNGSYDPAGPAAQSADWMYWDRLPLWNMGLSGTSVSTSYQFDIRSKRRLEDWGDTLIACWRGTGSAPATTVTLSTSTLLLLP